MKNLITISFDFSEERSYLQIYNKLDYFERKFSPEEIENFKVYYMNFKNEEVKTSLTKLQESKESNLTVLNQEIKQLYISIILKTTICSPL
jgi:hypothetical protein